MYIGSRDQTFWLPAFVVSGGARVKAHASAYVLSGTKQSLARSDRIDAETAARGDVTAKAAPENQVDAACVGRTPSGAHMTGTLLERVIN